jgi:hypothetical protein
MKPTKNWRENADVDVGVPGKFFRFPLSGPHAGVSSKLRAQTISSGAGVSPAIERFPHAP